MIFTIGHAASYDRYLEKSLLPLKVGLHPPYFQKGERYLGGCAFATSEAAAEHATGADREGSYAVYKLEGEMERDAYQVAGENFHRLKHDLKILGKV